MARPDPRPVDAPSGSALPKSPPVSPPRPSVPVAPAREAPILDEAYQLPVHKGKVSRVTGHVKGAATSLTDWFELRIALLKQEVRDEIDTKKRQAEGLGKAYGAAAVFGLVTALVALFVAGFLFSALWGLLLGPEQQLWSLTLGYFTLMMIAGIGFAIAISKAEKKKRELTRSASSDPSTS